MAETWRPLRPRKRSVQIVSNGVVIFRLVLLCRLNMVFHVATWRGVRGRFPMAIGAWRNVHCILGREAVDMFAVLIRWLGDEE